MGSQASVRVAPSITTMQDCAAAIAGAKSTRMRSMPERNEEAEVKRSRNGTEADHLESRR
jgi:hypothetical protein